MISGAFYNHPRLGFCILVNTATTPGRQTFTLAHELAHVLFHYQDRALVSRPGDPERIERFADAFAAHFLVPGDALRKQVAQRPYQNVASAFDVVDMQRFFRVSYATLLNRLRSEGLLSREEYEEYRGYSPSDLQRRLGRAYDEYSHPRCERGISLGCYPMSILDRVIAMIKSEDLSPAGAADLLQVALEEILGGLLMKPAPANEDEAREFAELPGPTVGRRKGRS